MSQQEQVVNIDDLNNSTNGLQALASKSQAYLNHVEKQKGEKININTVQDYIELELSNPGALEQKMQDVRITLRDASREIHKGRESKVKFDKDIDKRAKELAKSLKSHINDTDKGAIEIIGALWNDFKSVFKGAKGGYDTLDKIQAGYEKLNEEIAGSFEKINTAREEFAIQIVDVYNVVEAQKALVIQTGQNYVEMPDSIEKQEKKLELASKIKVLSDTKTTEVLFEIVDKNYQHRQEELSLVSEEVVRNIEVLIPMTGVALSNMALIGEIKNAISMVQEGRKIFNDVMVANANASVNIAQEISKLMSQPIIDQKTLNKITAADAKVEEIRRGANDNGIKTQLENVKNLEQLQAKRDNLKVKDSGSKTALDAVNKLLSEGPKDPNKRGGENSHGGGKNNN